MNRHIHMLSSDADMFPEDEGVPENKVIKGIAFDGREKAVEGAEAEHSWPTIGIALGAGVLIGCLLARTRARYCL